MISCRFVKHLYISCNYRYYDKGEIKEFDGVECEWPMFYIFMIIDGVFKNLPDQITEYQELLKALIVLDKHGGNTIHL